ncbi:MAG: GAF domain-containing protein [Ardenticatenaceae bacterium]|nr:GAF domain-containing protein [Ardenticatenaceae bacterium]
MTQEIKDTGELRSSLKRQRDILAFLQEVMLAVSRAQTADSVFQLVLNKIATFMHWPLAHVYRWSESEQRLISSQIWYSSQEDSFELFRRLTTQTKIASGEGVTGKLQQSSEPVIIVDVTQTTEFIRQTTLTDLGLRAYFAFPVQVAGEVTAVLEFFSPLIEPPHPDIQAIIQHIATQVGTTLQRIAAEQILRQSEMQLAEAQRLAHIGHWEWNITANRMVWSDELYRIFGWQPGEVTPSYQAFLKPVHSDDVAYVQRKFSEAVQHGRSFTYFHRIIRPNGLTRVIHARGQPLYNEAGQITKLRGTAQDMTEQKETELQLSKTVRQLSTLNEMGQAIAASLDLHVIYERVLSAIRPLLRAEAVLLLLHEQDELVVTAMSQDTVSSMVGLRTPDGVGIAGQAWQTGQPLHLRGEACLHQLSPSLSQPVSYQPQAVLAVPIHWQEQRIGVLEATHSNPHAFTDDDLHLLEMAGNWTAVAIGNARQHGQLQRQLKESEAIARISQALAQITDLDKVLQLIVDLAHQIVPQVDWAVIHLTQGEKERLRPAAAAGLEISLSDYEMNIGEGIAGRVIHTGNIINVTDLQKDPRRLPIDQSINVRSLLVAPVQGSVRRIGTISLQRAIPNTFQPEDEQLVTILGIQAGMAIENARLLENQRRARLVAEKRRERMRRLSQLVITAQEEERQRISRELHDEAGQSLTSLKISLDMIQDSLPDELAEVRESLSETSQLADQTMSKLRLLAHNLRPPGLDSFGLDAALAGLCQDFTTHTPIQVTYVQGDIPDLPQLTALSLYRFAQEALTNVAKHAKAKTVEVKLLADAEHVVLSVVDDGCGFDLTPDDEVPAQTAGIGLAGMYERMEMVGGNLEVYSRPGEGTMLMAFIPLPDNLEVATQ